jgi:hypothetical protein
MGSLNSDEEHRLREKFTTLHGRISLALIVMKAVQGRASIDMPDESGRSPSETEYSIERKAFAKLHAKQRNEAQFNLICIASTLPEGCENESSI